VGGLGLAKVGGSSADAPTIDVSGPCDDPEHANDPRCTGGGGDGGRRNRGPGGGDDDEDHSGPSGDSDWPWSGGTGARGPSEPGPRAPLRRGTTRTRTLTLSSCRERLWTTWASRTTTPSTLREPICFGCWAGMPRQRPPMSFRRRWRRRTPSGTASSSVAELRAERTGHYEQVHEAFYGARRGRRGATSGKSAGHRMRETSQIRCRIAPG
jgi:hypothetical protein